MILYVNGDSYSAVSNGKRYSDFLGESLGRKVINNAIPGSCNDRIFRTSLRDLIQLKLQYSDVIAVISLSFPIRTELWDQHIKNNKFSNDGEFTSIQPVTSKDWYLDKTISEKKYKEFCKQFLTYYNIEAETVKLLQNIILLTAWCKQNKVPYVIISGTLQEPIDFTAPFVKPFYDAMLNDSNIVNTFKNSFTEWCVTNGFVPIDNYTQEIHKKTYIIGHHGEAAHKAFANFLIDNYFHEI